MIAKALACGRWAGNCEHGVLQGAQFRAVPAGNRLLARVTAAACAIQQLLGQDNAITAKDQAGRLAQMLNRGLQSERSTQREDVTG